MRYALLVLLAVGCRETMAPTPTKTVVVKDTIICNPPRCFYVTLNLTGYVVKKP